MEAKKNTRITVKSLSEVFEKEMKGMKDKINNLEEKLIDSEAKIQILEDKLTHNAEKEIHKNIDGLENVKNVNRNLKTHFDTNHTYDKSIQCCVSDCDFQAQQIDVLTMHIGVDHLELVRSRL